MYKQIPSQGSLLILIVGKPERSTGVRPGLIWKRERGLGGGHDMCLLTKQSKIGPGGVFCHGLHLSN